MGCHERMYAVLDASLCAEDGQVKGKTESLPSTLEDFATCGNVLFLFGLWGCWEGGHSVLVACLLITFVPSSSL